jgi:DNA-directed RNA polymerase subunit beta'
MTYNTRGKRPSSDNSGQGFDSISIKIASPERVLAWSHGEVTKPETINYRTQRSEKNGLFDEKIFGPDKDYECYCGKYKGIRYKGIVCEKCGVEITRAIVRRERMGHIELASPVSHIWFLRGMPSRLGMVLGLSIADLEKVVYFAGYIITKVDEEERKRILKDLDAEFKSKVKALHDDKAKESLRERLAVARQEIESIQQGKVIDEVAYHNFSMRYSTLFSAGIGAEAVYEICKDIDVKKTVTELETQLEKAGAGESEKIHRRLGVFKALAQGDVRPDWMFLTRIPVIPPALRPMVALDGGRYATSDVNDLYRRVINRNNRLKKLKDIHAPEVILRNEKRILQEAVDALIDNSIRHGSQSTTSQAQRRPLKSLADNLKGKRGLFRQNLLGKRVDYSGRSVIVIGPDLKLDQCGLPKHMALELFRPFVIAELLKQELAFNIRGAGRLIEEGIPEVWAILENVTKGKYVLLNRAPTLHRLGIQAFRPVLIEGNAIQVHPLVCTAFNADFDGDQMAVHVPLSEEAQLEAREIMAANKNIMKPGSGDPVVSAKMLDIILGTFWMTKDVSGQKGEGNMFASPSEALTAYDFEQVGTRAKIKILAPETAKFAEYKDQIIETTVGRLLFNDVFPEDYPYLNEEIDRKRMAGIIDELVEKYGLELIPDVMDKVKKFGFTAATRAGVTWGIDDVVIPEEKGGIIAKSKTKADEIVAQYNMGLLSDEERRQKVISIWQGAKSEIESHIPATLDKNGSVYDMLKSGARGSLGNLTQMAGMKGLIASVSGETLEFPIISSTKEGLTPIEYFITTHGSRKGLADTALNTAKAGYLTRRLFDVAQDVVVTEEDCGSKEGIPVRRKTASGMEIPLAKAIRGRFLAEDVMHDGKTLFKKGELITKQIARAIDEKELPEVIVRSPLNCRTHHGVCVKCYGTDLGKNEIIGLGEAVGTVAAQAIGEPGTQLTMRTFHAGGTASVGGDITSGLPRVEEVFEKRKPKNPAIVSPVSGTVTDIETTTKEKVVTILPDLEDKKKGAKAVAAIELSAHIHRTLLVKVGDKVEKGQFLSDGSADLGELYKYAGKSKTQDYIISEISKLYELQGESVSRKHIELIVRQMFSRLKVKTPGGTSLAKGGVVDEWQLEEQNETAKSAGLEEAKALAVIMGITETSLSRKSFLSAASFQHTTRVLINAATRGTIDKLKGLKENVILGRLIPAGTGFAGSKKSKMIQDLHDQMEEEDRERAF